MGSVILCMGNTAKNPYVLKKPDISIYTVEELCYCIREHTFLMEEEIVCRELADWLRDECGLGELADSLYGFVRTKASASAFLTAVLEYTGYYPKEETERIEQFLKAGAGLDEKERQKNVADYLAGNGKYELAMLRYYELLGSVPEEDTTFRAKLFHNMGWVSSQLFLFDNAAAYFYQAYELSGEEESLLQYLAAKRLLLDEKAYVDFIVGQPESFYRMSMELEKRVEQIAARWKECGQAKELEDILQAGRMEPESYQSVLEDAAEQMKDKYRSMIREK